MRPVDRIFDRKGGLLRKRHLSHHANLRRAMWHHATGRVGPKGRHHGFRNAYWQTKESIS